MDKKQWIIIAIIAVIAIIGIVLGVVFGTRSSGKETSSSAAGQGTTQTTTSPITPPPLQPISPVFVPISVAPVTVAPISTSVAPITAAPITAAPITSAPVVITDAPTTAAPTTAAPTSELFGFLSGFALLGGEEFKDEASYQFQALTYLENTGGLGTFTDDQLTQRYALSCIFYATNAVRTIYTDEEYEEEEYPNGLPGWNTNTSWVSGEPSVDFCSWYGITCNAEGQVTEIRLNSNELTGSVPNEIILLADTLTVLDIRNNIIFNAGDAGLLWLGQLTALTDLRFGGCYFGYNGVPPFLSSLTNLLALDLSYTIMHGPMRPATFTNMTKLVYLEMGGLDYNTSIPLEIATLPSLTQLYVDNALITGNLNFMDSMENLAELWVDNNPGIRGTIPDTIGIHTDLATFSFTGCSLTGTLPTELGLLTNITSIWLYDNLLTGTIPEEIAELSQLTLFQVEDNELTGIMPDEVCQLRDSGGLLETLSSDCEGPNGTTPEVECSCCTCCVGPC